MPNIIMNLIKNWYQRIKQPANGPISGRLPHGNQLIQERERAKAKIVPCSLAQYCQAVNKLERPTDKQIGDFVKFVCDAHSWYKHLPILPPGKKFTFFMDPNIGMDQVVQPDGLVTFCERTDESLKFHYTWMTTKEYRSRYGYLSYESGAGTRFYIQVDDEVREYADLPYIHLDGKTFRIPREVADVASVELTAVIHEHTPEWLNWHGKEPIVEQRNPEDENTPMRWPEETGGEETLNKILTLLDQPDRFAEGANWINQMTIQFQPEKERLIREMTIAIHRMLELVLESKK